MSAYGAKAQDAAVGGAGDSVGVAVGPIEGDGDGDGEADGDGEGVTDCDGVGDGVGEPPSQGVPLIVQFVGGAYAPMKLAT